MTLIFQKQFRHAPLDLESNVLFEKLSQEKMSSEKAHKLFMQVSCPTCIDTILEQFWQPDLLNKPLENQPLSCQSPNQRQYLSPCLNKGKNINQLPDL